jgi:CRP-like cAMP-binding protein
MATMLRALSASDFLKITGKLAIDPDLDGVDFRVFLYLFSRLDFDMSMRVPQVEIAQALGKRTEHISRSIRRLKQKGIIAPVDKMARSPVFRLNPDYWK